MDVNKLKVFVNHLCIKNLKSDRVKCCSQCPFEEEITGCYPELKELFEQKRQKGLRWGL